MMIQALVIGFMISASQVCPPPAITLQGDSIITITCNDPYVEYGATAWSECDGDLSPAVTIDNSAVDTSTPGDYDVIYRVTDSLNQTTTRVRRIRILDNFSMTVNGAAALVTVVDGSITYQNQEIVSGLPAEYEGQRIHITPWECKRPYDDPGASAWDDCDRDLTAAIQVIGADNVIPGELTVPGEVPPHLITYIVENSRGDVITKYRAVLIVDTQEPVIALHGRGEAEINFVNPTNEDPEWWLSARSAYTARYGVEVDNGDMWDLPQRWRIREEFQSVDAPLQWHCDLPHYVDPGASAYDDCEGVLDPDDIILILTRYFSQGNVEVFQYVGRMGDADIYPPPGLANRTGDSPGYRAYYLTWDSSGNPRGPSGWRTVRSRLIEPIYAIGFTGVGGTTEITCHDDFFPRADVLAIDLCEGDISSRFQVSGQVNSAVPGSYQLRYDVENIYGTRGQAFRTVVVVDNDPPVIVLRDEQGTPELEPSELRIPWCALRDNGVSWWDEEWFVLQSGEGWTVMDACDDNTVLTTKVAVQGQQLLRNSLEKLASIRNQSLSGGPNNPYYIDPTPYLTTYELIHNVKDRSNNAAIPRRRNVIIVPTFPEIVLRGPRTTTIECGASYDAPSRDDVDILDVPEMDDVAGCDAGADEDFRFEIDIFNQDTGTPVNAIDTLMPGAYRIRYYAMNALGLGYETTNERFVVVEDTTPPVLTLTPLGDYSIEPELVWEAGVPLDLDDIVAVTAWDACDGEIPPETILREIGGLDLDAPQQGRHTVVYTASDGEGNEASEMLRIKVDGEEEFEGEDEGEEEILPTIELIDEAGITLECGDLFDDPGATASDDVDGNLTDDIVISGTVEPWAPGEYEITYRVTNSSGGSASVTRTVTVEDTRGPVITLRGAPSLTINLNSQFIEPGFSAEDACDGTVPVTVSGAVDTSKVDIYTLTYTAEDQTGNEADPLTRNIRVIDPKLEEDDAGGPDAQEGEIDDDPADIEDQTDCLGCQGCGAPGKSLADRFKHVVGDYLIIGMALIALISLSMFQKQP